MASIPTMPPPKINFSRFGYIGKKPLYAVDTPENLGTEFAKFKCTFEDFKNIYIENNNNENSKAMIEKQLKNRVKKCPNPGPRTPATREDRAVHRQRTTYQNPTP